MSTKITGYTNSANGWNAERISDIFFRLFDVNRSVICDVRESFFAGSDWVAVKEEEFKENDWCYSICGESETLLRLIKKEGNHYYSREVYQVRQTTLIKAYFIDFELFSEEVTKATHEQIQRILTVVAKHKEYKEGLRINSLVSGHVEVLRKGVFGDDRNFHYDPDDDDLTWYGFTIYQKGTWAKIVEEPKKEDWINENLKKAYKDYDRVTEDWFTKTAFSYKDIHAISIDNLIIDAKEYMVIPAKSLESEAKRRTV